MDPIQKPAWTADRRFRMLACGHMLCIHGICLSRPILSNPPGQRAGTINEHSKWILPQTATIALPRTSTRQPPRAVACRVALARSWRMRRPTPLNKRLVIDTNALPVRDRFDVWRDAFSDVHDVVVESGISADFRASCRNFAVRETVFGLYKTPARRVVRTTRHLARHDVDHLAVRVSLSGNIKGRQREQDYHVCPSGIVIGTFA